MAAYADPIRLTEAVEASGVVVEEAGLGNFVLHEVVERVVVVVGEAVEQGEPFQTSFVVAVENSTVVLTSLGEFEADLLLMEWSQEGEIADCCKPSFHFESPGWAQGQVWLLVAFDYVEEEAFGSEVAFGVKGAFQHLLGPSSRLVASDQLLLGHPDKNRLVVVEEAAVVIVAVDLNSFGTFGLLTEIEHTISGGRWKKAQSLTLVCGPPPLYIFGGGG